MKLRDVDLQLLLAFDALMRERHVTHAAQRLDVSQPAMSAALAKLRALLHDELLVRAGAALVPTELALAAWPRVQEAIAAVRGAFQAGGRFEPALAGDTFRLIAIDAIDALLMPAVMRVLRATAPGVRIELLDPRPRQFGEMLASGALDLAVSDCPDPPAFLKARRLSLDRLIGICRRGHPALQAPMTAASFCALPHVAVEPDAAQIYNARIDAALRLQGLRRQVSMVKPNFLALPFVLETSDLVACVPANLARRMSGMADIATFAIPFDLAPLELRMLWHPRTANSPAHEWLRATVASCAG
jgi:DNA-binding transcriptional LysR family regulator